MCAHWAKAQKGLLTPWDRTGSQSGSQTKSSTSNSYVIPACGRKQTAPFKEVIHGSINGGTTYKGLGKSGWGSGASWAGKSGKGPAAPWPRGAKRGSSSWNSERWPQERATRQEHCQSQAMRPHRVSSHPLPFPVGASHWPNPPGSPRATPPSECSGEVIFPHLRAGGADLVGNGKHPARSACVTWQKLFQVTVDPRRGRSGGS